MISYISCTSCSLRNNCQETCKDMEKILRARIISGYYERHLKRKEVVYNALKIEKLASLVAFSLKFGIKRGTIFNITSYYAKDSSSKQNWRKR